MFRAHAGMSLFYSYLKTAIRNLARHRIYSAINIIGLAIAIAFPIAYYATNQWLQTFAYRTELGIGIFLLGSIAMFLVVLTTITAQTLKVARANPADALRDE